MRWQDLLFLHWPVDPAALRLYLPQDLELETYDGKAWLGVVPFVMAATRFRWLPPMPTANHFPECNLRTYVRHKNTSKHGGRPGVWFFSLDAASRLAVSGARFGFGLPYFRADMSCRHAGEETHYESVRRDHRAPGATFSASWRATGDSVQAKNGSLDQFLTERYCLYARHLGRLVCGEITHQPWQLAPAEIDLRVNDMSQLVGLDLAGPPVSALVAKPIEVVCWMPSRA